MTRNDAVETRRVRIEKVNELIMKLFNNNKDQTEFLLDITLADIEYETGLTERRILEYASIGERRGRFIIDRENKKIKRVT
jgi:hypothetical protein